MSATQLILGQYEVEPTAASAPEAQGMAGGFVVVGTHAANTTAADIAMQSALREDGYKVVDVDWVEAAAVFDLDDPDFREEYDLIVEALKDPASGGVGYGAFRMYVATGRET